LALWYMISLAWISMSTACAPPRTLRGSDPKPIHDLLGLDLDVLRLRAAADPRRSTQSKALKAGWYSKHGGLRLTTREGRVVYPWTSKCAAQVYPSLRCQVRPTRVSPTGTAMLSPQI